MKWLLLGFVLWITVKGEWNAYAALVGVSAGGGETGSQYGGASSPSAGAILNPANPPGSI